MPSTFGWTSVKITTFMHATRVNRISRGVTDTVLEVTPGRLPEAALKVVCDTLPVQNYKGNVTRKLMLHQSYKLHLGS